MLAPAQAKCTQFLHESKHTQYTKPLNVIVSALCPSYPDRTAKAKHSFTVIGWMANDGTENCEVKIFFYCKIFIELLSRGVKQAIETNVPWYFAFKLKW